MSQQKAVWAKNSMDNYKKVYDMVHHSYLKKYIMFWVVENMQKVLVNKMEK